jgi:hypothetical protein
MSKICTICKIEKKLNEFNKNSSRYDGFQSECRECNKNKSKNYYLKNKKKMVVKINEARIERLAEYRQRFYDYLKTCSCIDCENNNPIVLDFDHINPEDKKHEVSKMLHDGYSWENILLEINKCDVRCANCHRIRTAEQQSWYRDINK